jgi:DNA polymerase I
MKFAKSKTTKSENFMDKEKLVIIDGNSLINRAFYALPLLTNSKGEFSNGVYGFTNILIKAILEIKPKYIVVALDYGKKTFRNSMYGAYKANRKPTPRELASQFPILRQLLSVMGINHVEIEGFEGDDIIGSISKMFDTENIIVTGDRDALQLISPNTQVWITKKGISEVKEMNEQSYFNEYGLYPNQVVDLKALMGDSSDNIPGVAGIGEITATNLLKEFGSLDNIYANLDRVKEKYRTKLEADKEKAYLSRNLATIKTDMPLNIKLEDLTYPFPFSQGVYDFFKEYEFNSLLKKTDLFANAPQDEAFEKYNANRIEILSPADVTKQLSHIKRAGQFCFEITSDKFSFAYDKNCEFWCNITYDLIGGTNIDNILMALKPIFEDENIEKMTYDKKQMMHILDSHDILLKGCNFDTLLAYYLLCVGERECSKGNLFSKYSLEESYQAVNLFYLHEKLLEDLENQNLKKLYDEVEFPLINVLYNMEKTGFKIDKDILAELQNRYSLEVEEMEQTIKRLAGVDFNVNSPKQLGEVLFDKLGLTCYNNKKKSTSIEHLQEMYELHPIVPAIIRYRKISKLLTTYLEPYKDLVKKDELVHTVFNQTLTATGRLSSSEPNLQNIPVREDEGKSLRKMFVSRYNDGLLVSADYSQIELRILAHCSEDETLVNAFNQNIDIHSLTASEVFGVPIQEVTAQMRRMAKAVNFGIIYGISEFGLSQNISTSVKQAKTYIDQYFARYPKIKAYMDKNIEIAKETGYAYSIFGRRRKINELLSRNYLTRNFGERVAMNMPLQGTASDIIKLAMIKVDNTLSSLGMKSKLILQVHDELIVDAPREEAVEVAKILRDSMENVVKLRAPLLVDVTTGKTWFDC